MHRAFNVAAITLCTLTLLSTLCLYLYPIVLGCSFPRTSTNTPAPFRLLVLGDPQLEGDSSLPDTQDGLFINIHTLYNDPERPRASTRDLLFAAQADLNNLLSLDIPLYLRLLRKKLDLLGNDYYLAHIYRTLHTFLNPTHVAVLGDLIGSQWVSDQEFDRRGRRCWERVFRHGRRVEDEITHGHWRSTLGEDKRWERRIINVAGNHDIGYAGDMTEERLVRFERTYGKANWGTTFTLPASDAAGGEEPELRLVILNTLNLDAPTLSPSLQGETYDFINEVIGSSAPVEDTTAATILLTHLPLHKESGICVDDPMIAYYGPDHGAGVREQNHLSYDSSKIILENIYGKSADWEAPAKGIGRGGVVLTGHDHEGCDVYHHIPHVEEGEERRWRAERWNGTQEHAYRQMGVPGLREVTVRSMMGEFGGNAGLLSGWFEEAEKKWRFEYRSCALGVQHWWWAVHVLDIVTVGVVVSLAALHARARWRSRLLDTVKEKTH